MSSKDPKYQTVAKGVRLEVDEDTNEVFIVFKVVDSKFEKHIKNNWLDNIELIIKED